MSGHRLLTGRHLDAGRGDATCELPQAGDCYGANVESGGAPTVIAIGGTRRDFLLLTCGEGCDYRIAKAYQLERRCPRFEPS